MTNKLVHFEKYSVAPGASRDYYGLKVLNSEVILNLWKVSYGPHLLPSVRITKFSEFNEDTSLKEEIKHVFGSTILNYLVLLTSEGPNTLLTLPRFIIEKLVKYLKLEDITKLFCVSTIGHEIFNTNTIWEILYKRLKKSSKLSTMEKEIGANQGFRKLAKDHQVRAMTKKHLKSLDDKFARSPKSSDRSEKVARSASVNLPKSPFQQTDVKSVGRKQSVDYGPTPMKSPVKLASEVKKKKLLAPRETADRQKFTEKNAAGEGYREMKFAKESSPMKSKSEKKEKPAKAKVLAEERELLVQKEQLRSVLLQADLSDSESKEFISQRALAMRSPRSIFTKPSPHIFTSPKPPKSSSQKKLKPPKTKFSASAAGNKLDAKKQHVSGNKSDDSEGSGMSFLMRRYLEASDEVARKFSECERLAHSTRNSSTQVNFDERVAERKPIQTRFQKHVTIGAQRPVSRNVGGSATNAIARLKTVKRN